MNIWILIIIIFAGPQTVGEQRNEISQMEALSSHANPSSCLRAMKRALAIQMPVAREFRCLKLRLRSLKNATCNLMEDTKGGKCESS
jgi:hypothetical protein